jgi:hypothetical protein
MYQSVLPCSILHDEFSIETESFHSPNGRRGKVELLRIFQVFKNKRHVRQSCNTRGRLKDYHQETTVGCDNKFLICSVKMSIRGILSGESGWCFWPLVLTYRMNHRCLERPSRPLNSTHKKQNSKTKIFIRVKTVKMIRIKNVPSLCRLWVRRLYNGRPKKKNKSMA